MPDAPIPVPVKPAVTTLAKTPAAEAKPTPPAAPVAASNPKAAPPLATTHPKTTAHDSDEEEADQPEAASTSLFPWIIALGALAAILVVVVLVMWSMVGAREATIEENKNRSDQVQVAATQLQTQLDDAKTEATRLTKQLAEAEAVSAQAKADLDRPRPPPLKSKAGSTRRACSRPVFRPRPRRRRLPPSSTRAKWKSPKRKLP